MTSTTRRLFRLVIGGAPPALLIAVLDGVTVFVNATPIQ